MTEHQVQVDVTLPAVVDVDADGLLEAALRHPALLGAVVSQRLPAGGDAAVVGVTAVVIADDPEGAAARAEEAWTAILRDASVPHGPATTEILSTEAAAGPADGPDDPRARRFMWTVEDVETGMVIRDLETADVLHRLGAAGLPDRERDAVIRRALETDDIPDDEAAVLRAAGLLPGDVI